MTVGQLKQFIADLSVGDDVEVSIDCLTPFGGISGYGFTVEPDPHGVRLTCQPFRGLRTVNVRLSSKNLDAARSQVKSEVANFIPLGSFDSGGATLAFALFEQAAFDAMARLRGVPGVEMILCDDPLIE